MDRGNGAGRSKGSLTVFLVLEDRSELVAGDTLSGCVEVAANGSLRLASTSVGLAFHIGDQEPSAERMSSPGYWHREHVLAEALDIEFTARIPFSVRLPLAPISCSGPLPIQPWLVARVVAGDGKEATDRVPLFVRPAPLAELHAGSRGDPYRTPSQKETNPSWMRPEQVLMLLEGRTEAEPVLSALSRVNEDLDRLPPAKGATSPPSIAALGEAIVISDPNADSWWTLCCRQHPKDGSIRNSRIVRRIEPNDVVDQREFGGGRRFRLVVPRDGPPSFAIGEGSVRWSVVAETPSPAGTNEVEYPLIVLPFVVQRPQEEVSSTWPRGKLARALRRIRAAKGS